MDQINEQSIVSRQKSIVFNKLDDEIVMMSIKNGEYYGLDNIGSRIWEIIERPVSVRQIIDILKNEYSVSESQCKNDVNEFLDLLLKKDLIRIS